MKTLFTAVAAIVSGLSIWVAAVTTGEAKAADHYRVGTLNESRHYRDNEDFNSYHDGIYFVHNGNVFGTYVNSEARQTMFYARSHRINDIFSYSYGVAAGYRAGLLPVVALSAQLGVVKLSLTQEAAVVGLEFPVF